MGFLDRELVDFDFLGGGETGAEHLRPEKLNNVIQLDSSMNIDSMQERVDESGSGTAIRFAPEDYTDWSQSLELYDDTVVVATGCTFKTRDGTPVDIFKNADFENGNQNITFVLYGSTFDGNRSTLGVGEDTRGIHVRGDNTGSNNTDKFTRNLGVYGGVFHNFRAPAINITRTIGGTITPDECYENGEPGDTADGGDGVYAAVCKDITVRDVYSHDNERHGVSFAGENANRSIDCKMTGIRAENNGNDGLNAEHCENMVIEGVSRSSGNNGVMAIGTGEVDVTVIDPGQTPYLEVSDYSATASIITGQTGDDAHMNVVLTSEGSAVHGVRLQGDNNASMTIQPTVKNAASMAVYNNQVEGGLTIENPLIETCGRHGIYLGNAASIEATVNGGRIVGHNGDNDTSNAVATGATGFGDRLTISGLQIGDPQFATTAINIQAGDFHSVTGVATGGQTISVAGASSAVAGNT